MTPEPWWISFAAPLLWWALNALIRLAAQALQHRAETLEQQGRPGEARGWSSAAAVMTNINIGRRPSFRPPPFGAIPTLPPPPRMPNVPGASALPPAGAITVHDSNDLRDTVRTPPRPGGEP